MSLTFDGRPHPVAGRGGAQGRIRARDPVDRRPAAVPIPMRIHQTLLTDPAESVAGIASLRETTPTLVLAFGAVAYFERSGVVDELRRRFPQAAIAGCSTAGEICGSEVRDGACVVTTVAFDRAVARAEATRLASMADSFAAGARLAAALPASDLRAVLVLGPGVQDQRQRAGAGAAVGIAAEGDHLRRAGRGRRRLRAHVDDGAARLRRRPGRRRRPVRRQPAPVGYGSFAGWVPFGPARKVTRCADNVLYELDGERALDIYKRYLGRARRGSAGLGPAVPLRDGRRAPRKARHLPDHPRRRRGAGVADAGRRHRSRRHAEAHALEHRAADRRRRDRRAARRSRRWERLPATALALLVSCVGRKLVMGDRVDEEVEVVGELFGRARR